jgi:hypothetical protein
MRFECVACGKEHGSASEYCEACQRFVERFEELVGEFEDPLPALRLYCQDEFEWVVFADEDEFDEGCLERMRELAAEGAL